MNIFIILLPRVLILLLVLIITVSFGEQTNSVSGFIFDQSTKLPIENANVYFSHTTWGSSTDKDGYYSIRRIPTGFHALVVSVVGYKVQNKKIFITAEASLKYNFSLEPLIYNTPVTIVEGEFPDEWLEDLEFFKRFFLGRNVFAENCSIENEIYLDFDRRGDLFFEAKVDRPLIVINRDLGYRIDCALIKFVRAEGTDLLFWSVMPRFSELIPQDDDEQQDWIKNRRKAYFGSVQHFLVSFFREKVEEENFRIWSVARPGQRYGRYCPLDSTRHYEYFIQSGGVSEQKKMQFEGFWKVDFGIQFTSWIWFNSDWITLDKFGYTREYDPFTVWGQWAKEGVANLVPKDFILEQMNNEKK